MKKFIYSVTIGLGIFFGIWAVNYLRPVPTGTTLSANTNRTIRHPTPTKIVEKVVYRPVRLRIPKLDVDTVIEEVQEDSIGAMDVPKKVENIGWYSLGVKPGAKGNAVIAGHLDTKTGAPAVFFNLSILEPGDLIQVTDEKNNVLTFVVQKKEAYPTDDFP